MINKHLHFLSDVGRKKMNQQQSEKLCPFCQRDQLTHIIATDGDIILLNNKYPTLDNTLQTVLIESDNCDAAIDSYDAEHMKRVITFGVDNWLKMIDSNRFESVVFYKNHGPLSGGSIDHAHMQIVGLNEVNYQLLLPETSFEGLDIYREGDCFVNISTKPNACPTEFNIITGHRNDDFLAIHIQRIVRYVTSYCDSYNLFFYQWQAGIVCKVVPRYVTSPFLIGFSISQAASPLESIVEKVQQACYV